MVSSSAFVHRLIHLQQRDGVAALFRAAQMEGRDIDLRLAQVRPRSPITPGLSLLVMYSICGPISASTGYP